MKLTVEITVEHCDTHGEWHVRTATIEQSGASRRDILRRALLRAQKWPEYALRDAHNLPVSCEAKIVPQAAFCAVEGCNLIAYDAGEPKCRACRHYEAA